MMKQERIEYGDVWLVIEQANVLMGIRRDGLIYRATQVEIEGEDEAMRYARTILYPSLVACVTSSGGRFGNIDFTSFPISFEDFCALPDDLRFKWQNAAMNLNPHWFGLSEENEVKKKKSS
ncbi:MAG: hypothetical protein QXS54_00170 [Candidatus Methanomethylicaceae archaeon]